LGQALGTGQGEFDAGPFGKPFDLGQGSWELAIDPRQPDRGAVFSFGQLVGGEAMPGVELFALPAVAAGSFQAGDSFVRGSDLHLLYAATGELPTSVSLCWRALDPEEWAVGLSAEEAAETLLLELVISFQTDLLDAVPVREAHSRMPAGKLLPLPPPRPAVAGEIERRGGENTSFIDAAGRHWLSVVYPSDLRWLATSVRGGEIEQQIRLRVENLEKGVIRRLRCLFATAPASAHASLLGLPLKFAESQLPLAL
jgi:hypothetical protein